MKKVLLIVLIPIWGFAQTKTTYKNEWGDVILRSETETVNQSKGMGTVIKSGYSDLIQMLILQRLLEPRVVVSTGTVKEDEYKPAVAIDYNSAIKKDIAIKKAIEQLASNDLTKIGDELYTTKGREVSVSLTVKENVVYIGNAKITLLKDDVVFISKKGASISTNFGFTEHYLALKNILGEKDDLRTIGNVNQYTWIGNNFTAVIHHNKKNNSTDTYLFALH
jgi:hypothetical protein